MYNPIYNQLYLVNGHNCTDYDHRWFTLLQFNIAIENGHTQKWFTIYLSKMVILTMAFCMFTRPGKREYQPRTINQSTNRAMGEYFPTDGHQIMRRYGLFLSLWTRFFQLMEMITTFVPIIILYTHIYIIIILNIHQLQNFVHNPRETWETFHHPMCKLHPCWTIHNLGVSLPSINHHTFVWHTFLKFLAASASADVARLPMVFKFLEDPKHVHTLT